VERYYPMAMQKMTDEEKKYDLHGGILYTYTSTSTIEDAIEVIRAWRDDYDYNIDYAWIDKYEGDKKVDIIKVDYAPITSIRETDLKHLSQ